MKRSYIGFAKIGNQFGPAEGRGEYSAQLPAGHYKVDYDRYQDELMLTKFDPTVDEILNLGGVEFNSVINNVNKFLSPNTKELYVKNGFLYKRSFFFHGPPGTGKSVLATQISNLAVEQKDAVAIYPSEYEALERMLEVLSTTDKDRFVCIGLEEFDGMINRHDESQWTTLLDGQFQSPNRLMIATTNNIGNINRRMLRPGRFSSLVHIPALTKECRIAYLNAKGIKAVDTDVIATDTEGFTIDELKEVVQNFHILGEPLDQVLKTIKDCKKLGSL